MDLTQVPDDQLDAMIQQAQGAGSQGRSDLSQIPDDQLDAMIHQAESQYRPSPEAQELIVRGGSGPEMGYPIIGPALKKAGNWLLPKIVPSITPEQIQSFENQAAQRNAEFAENNPVVSKVPMLASMAMLPFPSLPVVGNMPGIGGVMKQALKGVMPTGEQAVGAVGGTLARAGAVGAIGAADAGVASDWGGNATDIVNNMAQGFKSGAGLSLGMESGAGAVGAVPGWAGRFVAGVKPETEAYYRSRSNEVNAADEQAVRDNFDNAAAQVLDPVEQAKIALQDAKEQASNAKMSLREELRTTRPPDTLPGQIAEAYQELREGISAASTEGFNALTASGETVNAGRMKAFLRDKMNEMQIGPPAEDLDDANVHPAFKPAFDALRQEYDFIDQLGQKELRPEDVKKIVQGLDVIESNAYATAAQPGGYITQGDRALMGYRRFLDGYLKEYPDYAEAMQKAKSQMDVLNAAQKFIGTDEPQISKRLQNLDPYQQVALDKLSQFTGQDFSQRLAPYQSAQETVKSPTSFQGLYQATPEAQALENAQTQLDTTQAVAAPYKRWTPDNTEKIIRSLSYDRGTGTTKTLREKVNALDQNLGTNLSQQAQDLGVKDAFNKPFMNGSRNVNLGRSFHGVLRSVIGEGSSGILEPVGAVLGHASDLVGPQMYKRWIDLSMDPDFQKYAGVLNEAASRGPAAIFAAHYVLMQQDKKYQEMMNRSQEK